MGNYSALRIDKIELAWKYQIPSFLTFLFEKKDFYHKPKRLTRYTEWYNEIGYATTRKKALETLNRYGYNIDFFSEVYSTFYNDLHDHALDILTEKLWEKKKIKSKRQHEKALKQYLRGNPPQDIKKDLQDFISFISRSISQDFNNLSNNIVKTRLYTDSKLINFDELQHELSDNICDIPLSIVKVAQLFDELTILDYPEIILLMLSWLLIEAAPKNSKVILDLADIVESKKEVKQIHSELAKGIINKVDLYNKTFKVLYQQKEDVQAQFAKRKLKSLLPSLSKVKNKNDKGDILEQLMSVVFEAIPGLKVEERNYSTGDEEIDLLIKNDIAKPFWQGLSSPLLFVECKNWQKPIGSSDIRNFEIKLQNHRPLVKVGFIVAVGGFTSECNSEIKRSSREEYNIICINKKDLDNFASSNLTVLDWLESKICQIK